jgi:Flp pilus assembly pilin Flp
MTTPLTLTRDLHADESGATAIEFAFVMPVFLMLVVGIINLSLLVLATASLHYAVEKGARCASVKGTCPDSEFKSYYFAPGPLPTFIADPKAACGHALSATVPYNINAVFFQKSIILSAASCFP